MDIEEELALNYGVDDEEEQSTFRDSLEAELMLNYETDVSLRSIENTPKTTTTPRKTVRNTPRTASTPRVVAHDKLRDPLEDLVVSGVTPTPRRRTRRGFVLPSPPASTPRRVVLPHDKLKDPLDGIFGRTSSVSRISSVSSVSSRSSFFEPSSSRISLSSSVGEGEEDEDEEEDEEQSDESLPSNALFSERANARHRSDLDVLLGSKRLRLASATLFDIIMPRASNLWKSKNIQEFPTESWRWVRMFLDKSIDLEVGANVWCSDGKIETDKNDTNRVRFRTFDLSTISMPSKRTDTAGFLKMVDLISKHVEMSKKCQGNNNNNKILCCIVEALREFVNCCSCFVRKQVKKKSALRTKESMSIQKRLETRYNKSWCVHIQNKFPTFRNFSNNVYLIHEIVGASHYYLQEISKLVDSTLDDVPFERTLIGLVESQLRYSLRCVLNDEEDEIEMMDEDDHDILLSSSSNSPSEKNTTPTKNRTISFVSNSGSLFYNEDDLAAVVSRALHSVDTSNNNNNNIKDEERLDAFTFLIKLFSEPILYENARSGIGSWSTLQRTVEITKRAGISHHKMLSPFVRLDDMDTFFEWLRSEQETTKQKILSSCAPSTKKKKRKRRRRSLSGRHKKKINGLGFSFPKLRACKKNSYRDDWICSICTKVVKSMNPGGEIACDFCGNWYHLRCLSLPPEFAMLVDTYKCPNCSGGDK